MNALDTDELEGLTELGSRKEALSRAAEFLDTSGLTDEEFREALRAILTHDFVTKRGKYHFNSARWAPRVEHSYAAMPAGQQRRLRPAMLWFFSQWNEKRAAEFLDWRYSDSGDVATALRVVLTTEQPRARVQQLAKQAEAFLGSKLGDFESDDLHAALAEYCVSHGDVDAALAHAKAICHLDIFAEQALQWPVELQVAGALAAAREQIAALEEYRRRPPSAMDLVLPRYRDTELDKAARKLTTYERKLRALRPSKLIAKWIAGQERVF